MSNICNIAVCSPQLGNILISCRFFYFPWKVDCFRLRHTCCRSCLFLLDPEAGVNCAIQGTFSGCGGFNGFIGSYWIVLVPDAGVDYKFQWHFTEYVGSIDQLYSAGSYWIQKKMQIITIIQGLWIQGHPGRSNGCIKSTQIMLHVWITK